MQVLYIDKCPSWEAARTHTRDALDHLGMTDVPVEFVIIHTADEAANSAFAGSPTIVVNGQDLFPSDQQTNALACRVYPTESGLAGAPSQAQIEHALESQTLRNINESAHTVRHPSW